MMHYTPTRTPDLYARFSGISNSGPRALKALSPSPVAWLPLQERTDGAKVPFMPEKVRLLAVLRPEADGI